MAVRFSIIVPVLNEAYTINRTLAHLENRTRGKDCEVLVVDGHPRATTLRVIDYPWAIRLASPPGRGGQMARGAARAQGDILLFLHADTHLPEGALAAIDRSMTHKGVVGGAFDLTIDAPGPAYRIIEAMANRRSRLTRIPYGDQAIFLDRAFYERIGGFQDLPLMEDVALMRRVKKAGGTIILLPQRVVTSARRWKSEGVVYGTWRNWTLVTLYLLGVPPSRLVRLYGTRKETRTDKKEA
ncbi:MAG: TIGR04283 family arsenosugar biosynthesis glycosyltransferase [Desulfobacterales bacterium]|nr:TIGR04283 family arsenosugar biosynthesis glycosyltransferase [Desulfobacterales bacterium]